MAKPVGVGNYCLTLSPEYHTYFDRDETNLESYQLLWADLKIENIDIDDGNIRSTLAKFRQLVNYTKAFDHWRTCLNYIKTKSNYTYTFLVCSAAYAEQIFSELCDSDNMNVWKIYVYGAENQPNLMSWPKYYIVVSEI